MLSEEEVKRLRAKCDGGAVLDANLKEPIQKEQLKETVASIEKRLRRTRPGARIAVFWGEVK